MLDPSASRSSIPKRTNSASISSSFTSEDRSRRRFKATIIAMINNNPKIPPPTVNQPPGTLSLTTSFVVLVTDVAVLVTFVNQSSSGDEL